MSKQTRLEHDSADIPPPVIGTLKGYDQLMNLVLDEVKEAMTGEQSWNVIDRTLLIPRQTTKATYSTASSASLSRVAHSLSSSRPSTAAKRSPTRSYKRKSEHSPSSICWAHRTRICKPATGRLCPACQQTVEEDKSNRRLCTIPTTKSIRPGTIWQRPDFQCIPALRPIVAIK